jgi:hypothetical protein
MIETQFLDYVSGIAGAVPCRMELPPEPPATLIVIERTGGTVGETEFNTATFAVQTCGSSLYNAAMLARDIVPKILRMKYDVENVSSIKVNAGPYNFTDTDNKKYRYQTVFELSYYETEE